MNNINDKYRLTATSISEYLTNIENELILSTKSTPEPLIYLKNYKGSFSPVQTTHSAPIGQQTTGWGEQHYYEIGWNGNVGIKFKCKHLKGFGSDILRGLSLHSGTGGYNGGEKQNEYHLCFDSRMYLKDFPLLHEQYYQFWEDMKTIVLMFKGDLNDKQLATEILSTNAETQEKIDCMCKKLTIEPSTLPSTYDLKFKALHGVWENYQSNISMNHTGSIKCNIDIIKHWYQ